MHVDGPAPGVWFFSLDASMPLAVAAARAAYNLPYYGAEIDSTFVAARSRRSTSIRAGPTRAAHSPPMPTSATVRRRSVDPAAPGTLEHFLVERYILYAGEMTTELHRARVHHQPYPSSVPTARCSTKRSSVQPPASAVPSSAPLRHYATEVNVKVYPLGAGRTRPCPTAVPGWHNLGHLAVRFGARVPRDPRRYAGSARWHSLGYVRYASGLGYRETLAGTWPVALVGIASGTSRYAPGYVYRGDCLAAYAEALVGIALGT